MKYVKHVIAVLLLVLATGTLMGNACSDATEKLCGPCGKVATGDGIVSGDAKVDGFLTAVTTLNQSVKTIKGNFDGRVKAMAEGVFGLDVAGKTTAELVAEIKGEFSATGSIGANLQGGLAVDYQPPQCKASLDVQVQAQAKCEAKVDANCSAEFECEGGELSFTCSGKCEGSCSGTCEVPSCKVEVTPGSLECSGECRGGCAADVSGECSGKCEGTCSGSCSAHNASGQCEGKCDGTCSGKCEVQAEASCTGECRGECVVTGPDAEASCDGGLGCSGSCEGECSGSCKGEASAPKCDGQASCSAEASAECEAQASAQASASLECTPPSLQIGYEFAAGVSAEAQAEVTAKLEKFKVEMGAIIQGNAELKALVQDDAAAEMGLEQAPVKSLLASIQGLVTALAQGDVKIESAQALLCATDQFNEAVTILTGLPGKVTGTIEAQVELMGVLGI